MIKKGMLVIISGPSGSGKGTVVKNLKNNDKFALSISMTTRGKREGEIDGKDYMFVSREQFVEMRNDNGFLEHAEFCGNMYGTPKSYVNEQREKGKNVILEIDVIGALQIKEKFEDCVLIFLMPPTREELERRLVGRNTEDKDTIKRRLIKATSEIQVIEQYDYLVINEVVEHTAEQIEKIVVAESRKPIRCMEEIAKFKGDE